MLKQSLSTPLNAKLIALLFGVVMVLSSVSASAISLEYPRLQNEIQYGVQSSSSDSVMQGIRHAQNRSRDYQDNSQNERALRSRREVMQEVKRRYNGAEVLKISLNQGGTSYNVRVLMPSGTVRSLQVSALR